MKAGDRKKGPNERGSEGYECPKSIWSRGVQSGSGDLQRVLLFVRAEADGFFSQIVNRFQIANRFLLGSHENAGGHCLVASDSHAIQQSAVGDSRRAKDDLVSLGEVIRKINALQ